MRLAFPPMARSVPVMNAVFEGKATGSSEPINDRGLKGAQKIVSRIISSPGFSVALATMKTNELSGSKASEGEENLLMVTPMNL